MALNYDGQTTTSYVNIYDNEDTVTGFILIGGIFNDASLNSMVVKLIVNDLFDGTDQVTETTILPGTFWKLNTLVEILTGRPPYSRIRVDVKSLLPGLHADFRARGLDIEN